MLAATQIQRLAELAGNGPHSNANPGRRVQHICLMNKRSEVLVDGGGVGRVLQAVLYGANEEALRLRAASQEDVLLLWQWANDPVTRRNSFVPEPISWAVQEA